MKLILETHRPAKRSGLTTAPDAASAHKALGTARARTGGGLAIDAAFPVLD